jgi:hypothetical protein
MASFSLSAPSCTTALRFVAIAFAWSSSFPSSSLRAENDAGAYIKARQAMRTGSLEVQVTITDHSVHPERRGPGHRIRFVWDDRLYKIAIRQSSVLEPATILLNDSDLIRVSDGDPPKAYFRLRKDLKPGDYPPCLTDPRLIGLKATAIESIGLDGYHSLIGRSDVNKTTTAQKENGVVEIVDDLVSGAVIRSQYRQGLLLQIEASSKTQETVYRSTIVMTYGESPLPHRFPKQVIYKNYINKDIHYGETIDILSIDSSPVPSSAFSLASLELPNNTPIQNRTTGERRFVVGGAISEGPTEESPRIRSPRPVLIGTLIILILVLAILVYKYLRRPRGTPAT